MRRESVDVGMPSERQHVRNALFSSSLHGVKKKGVFGRSHHLPFDRTALTNISAYSASPYEARAHT